MTRLNCTPENVVAISEFCERSEIQSDVECFSKDVPVQFSTFVAVWCILNAICGTCGNLMTLLAIPWATKSKR